MGSYIKDVCYDLLDYMEDFKDHLVKKRKKAHKRMRKGVGKKGRPAYALAERIRGVIYVIVGLSIAYSAFIGVVSGVTGMRDFASFMINNLVGRIIITSIGVAYLIHGTWKIVMGAD
ncbi:MAG: DUF1206 domain-containing protein [Candidatus Altiarchaeota archaeon]